MSTLMARHVPPEVVTRVRQYARTRPDLSTSQAISELLVIALDHLEARKRAGSARHAGTTARERTESARAAAEARWAKVRAE